MSNFGNQQEQALRLTKNVFETNYLAFDDFVSRYDAFQDMPFSEGLTFVAADALFSNSKFILSVRDPDDWYVSVKAFHKKIYDINPDSATESDVYEKFNYLYKGFGYDVKRRFLTFFSKSNSSVDWEKLYNRDLYIDHYVYRNNLIKKYFTDAPHKLLVIDVTKEATTKKLCDFLNIPPQFVIPMLHKNKT